MTVRARAALAAGVTLAALVAGVLAPASADDLSDQSQDLEDKISATEDALQGASSRLREAAADLDRAQSQLPAARAEFSAATGRLSSARERLALIRQKLRQLRAEQEKVQTEIELAQRRIVRSETLIARIVRYQYQTGGYAELQVVLDADSPTDFVQRVMATRSVTESQAEVIDRLNADQAVLAARQQQMQVTVEAIEAIEAEAEEQVLKLRDLVQEARAAKQKIERLVQLRSHALRVAERERASEVQRLNQLKAAQDALQAQIAQSTSTGTATGSLMWPAPGYGAGQGVGWRVHPIYGYRSCHTGVDISAPGGTEILAARSGVVVWARADLSGPWGYNVLVDHGNGLSTFYPHQASLSVSRGQRVRQGEVIGYVGSTGYSTGPHLHFEVHINGVPYDPMGWFGGQKTPQSQFCP